MRSVLLKRGWYTKYVRVCDVFSSVALSGRLASPKTVRPPSGAGRASTVIAQPNAFTSPFGLGRSPASPVWRCRFPPDDHCYVVGSFCKPPPHQTRAHLRRRGATLETARDKKRRRNRQRTALLKPRMMSPSANASMPTQNRKLHMLCPDTSPKSTTKLPADGERFHQETQGESMSKATAAM